MDITRRIRDKMMKGRLMFVYRGVVTNENSVPLLMLLEKEMENSDFGFIGRKRLFMFVLESLQNVSRHGDHRQHADMSLVIYSKTDSGYTVTTGNVLSNDKTNDLKTKLDEINSLKADEIRNAYRQMLGTTEFSNKGGAGLGLLEMAKKTGNKLDYDFAPIDDEYSYFILSKTVNSLGIGVHQGGEEKTFDGKVISQIERLMSENNIYLIWSGHVSADVEREVLSFAETRLVEEDVELNLRRRVFSVLVEILENLSKYSPGKEPEKEFGMPIAMIRYDDSVYSLTTGNLIENKNIEVLKGKIEIINKHDKVGLKELFRNSISGLTVKSETTGTMGLIDMARKSGSKLDYQFENINDLYSYFMLTVKVDGKE
jgi:hypothetical protein